MAEDHEMVMHVRKIVTANFIDTSQVRVRVTRGVINFQGHVISTGGDANFPEGKPSNLRRLDTEVRALKGFKGVTYTFDNWIREAVGSWKYTGRGKQGDDSRSSRKRR